MRLDGGYLFILVALIGTTITPYMSLYVQSSVADKGVSMRDYATRAEIYAGSLFANLVSCFIIIATAAALFLSGVTRLDSAADAARALEPLAGRYASALFAVGLLGASLLADDSVSRSRPPTRSRRRSASRRGSTAASARRRSSSASTRRWSRSAR